MDRFNNKQIEVLSRHISFKQCEIIAESYGYSVNTLYNVLRGNSKIKTTSRNKKAMIKDAIDFAMNQAKSDLKTLENI